MIYPIGGCSTHPIIHVAVADVDAAYGAYAAAEHNTFNNTNNSNNTAYNNANNNANNDGKTRYLKQHRKPPGENHLSESSTRAHGSHRLPGDPMGPPLGPEENPWPPRHLVNFLL